MPEANNSLENAKFEQLSQENLTIEQKIQSDARRGVLKFLDNDDNLTPEDHQQLLRFASLASENALSEYESVKKEDPLLVIQSLIEENKALFPDGYPNPNSASSNIKEIQYLRSHLKDMASSPKTQGNPDEFTAIIRNSVAIRMENPELYKDRPDTNLAFLQALGAIPENVTDLRKYIHDLPEATNEDYWEENGPKRAVQYQSGDGLNFRGLPTKIDGVFVQAQRLYSTDTRGYGQFGFSLGLNNDAIARIKNALAKES